MTLSETLGLSGINWGGYASTSMTIIYFLVIAGIVGGVVWFIIWLLGHKHTVIIKEPLGKSFEYKTTKPYKDIKDDTKTEHTEKIIKILPFIGGVYKAKIITKKNIHWIQTLFPIKRLKIPDNVYQAITKKGKKFIELTKLSEHIYAPTVLTDIDVTRFVYDESYFAWVVNDIEQDMIKYSSNTFWDRYGQFITTAATLVLCLIIIVVVLKHSQTLVKSVSEATQPLVKALTDAVDKIAVQKV